MTASLRTTLLLLCVGAFLATQPGASCVSDTSSDGSGTQSEEKINEIPRRAAILGEGRGVLEYKTDADGDLYVQDLKDVNTIVKRHVYRGQIVRVVPDENRVRVDDDTIYRGDLKKNHVHRVYLLRDRRFDDDRRMEDRRDDSDHSNIVPRDAKVIGEGANKEISFKADHDGEAYLLESDARKLITTIDVKRGQRFTFSPGINRITVDGKTVLKKDFDPRTKYRIYFK